ncbi:hypothetical protein [Gluconobacter kondonii]|uniref:hypothetical protein n=1 Tax=Gluconobacter kondonii TaxID=941463 RepID=UPI001B8B0B80|nr:hypothetical protein [Gluconobacter kondonii]MBS1082328.1 hypothetical protein [Gluconobacter kondonii]
MPYDSNGNYTLPAVYKATPGTTIMTEQHNTPLEDIQSALNKAFLRDGSVPFLAHVNANSFRITNIADGINNGDAVNLSQLNGLLSNTALTGNTNSQNLTVSGTAIVPAVSDWTTYQAVGAKDAYGAFLRLGGTAQISSSPTTFSNGLNTALGVSAWSPTNTQVMSVGDAYGAFLRNAGPAQTSSCPTTFTNGLTSDSTYVGTLSALSGTVDVTVLSGLRMGLQTLYCNSLAADGNSELKVTTNFRMGTQTLYCNNIQPDGDAIRAIGGNTNVSNFWNFSQRPAVNGTNVALTTDLPLSVGQRIEAFTVSNVYSNTRVNFPTGFSAKPQSVVICDAETGNQVLWCKAKDWDAGGFTFMANAGNTCPLLSVIAIGNS